MAIIESWVPPSREHWELITFLWQFFPLVYATVDMKSKRAHSDPDHLVSMVDRLVSPRENVYQFAMEHSWKDWLGNNGSAGLPAIALHHVHPTERESHE